MTLVERYRSGECEQVYRELRARPDHADAAAVAREMMRRVRANLERLAERWREHGFELADPLGELGREDEALARLEQAHGPLPVTLRAFYTEVGWVDFVETPPDDDWPDVEHLDPIQVLALGAQLDDLLESDEPQLLICHDPLIKFDIGGVGPLYVPLPATGFDAILHFEGAPMDLDGELSFVRYLRTTLLERGGLGPAGGDDVLPRKLHQHLTADLEPF